jgi:hypothetical protein
MSRILRRPMFRGGSTSNEGIMSVPRKKYEEAGFVNEDEIGNDQSFLQSGTITNPTGITISDSDIDLNKIDNLRDKTIQSKQSSDSRLKNLSASDLLMQEYIGNRPDPMGKFLINFGLNYMSARPRGGKFGAFATAADAAKKPTEQLYADIDTDRLLKLKLMSALGKSESKVALEKEARLLVEQGYYPDMKTALGALMKARLEKKTLTPEERILAREKSFELDQPLVKRAKAKLFEFGLPKLGAEEKNVDMNNTFINQGDLIKKPNSTDAQLVKPPQNIEKTYKTGKIYIDLESRNAYKYVGPNTFRFVTALEE